MDIRCQEIGRVVKDHHKVLNEDVLKEFLYYKKEYSRTDALAAHQNAIHVLLDHIPHWLPFDLQPALSHGLVQLASQSGFKHMETATLSQPIALEATRITCRFEFACRDVVCRQFARFLGQE